MDCHHCVKEDYHVMEEICVESLIKSFAKHYCYMFLCICTAYTHSKEFIKFPHQIVKKLS